MDYLFLIVYGIVCILLGWIGTKGYYGYMQGVFEQARILLDTFGPEIEDKELYKQLHYAVITMEDALADNALTMAEFCEIVRTCQPIIKKVKIYISNMG